MCICSIVTILSISDCVSDRVHLRIGSTSNLFLFLFFKFNKSKAALSHRIVIAKGKIYLINKLNKCRYNMFTEIHNLYPKIS